MRGGEGQTRPSLPSLPSLVAFDDGALWCLTKEHFSAELRLLPRSCVWYGERKKISNVVKRKRQAIERGDVRVL